MTSNTSSVCPSDTPMDVTISEEECAELQIPFPPEVLAFFEEALAEFNSKG